MAHKQQKNFCIKIRNSFPEFFIDKDVLDVGSYDINGNNRFLFNNCNYMGIDVGTGDNVDIVCPAHLHVGTYDTIVSTEALEHDKYYKESLIQIVHMLKPGGLYLFTCATTGRNEHGTRRTTPSSAPLLMDHLEQDWGDWYKNITEKDVREVLDVEGIFSKFSFEIGDELKDLYFYGIKKLETT